MFIITFSIFSQEFEIDRGTLVGPENILNINDIEWDETVEIIFVNPISRNEIYYTGAYYRGEGLFWINLHGNETEILRTYLRYGPMIKWHGENIVEIYIPTGSPNRHSYFYNYRYNILSSSINFPIYYDVANDIIIAIEHWGLDLYSIKNTDIIRTFNFEESIPVLYIFVFGNYELRIEDNKLYFRFEIKTGDIDIEREYIFDYN